MLLLAPIDPFGFRILGKAAQNDYFVKRDDLLLDLVEMLNGLFW